MIRDELANRLKFFRERAGMTIYEVGSRIGKSGKTVSAWEKGRGQPDADMLITLCDLYDISSIAELLGQKEEQPQISAGLQLSPLEEEIVEAYRAAPDVLQKAVLDILHIQPPASLPEQKQHA